MKEKSVFRRLDGKNGKIDALNNIMTGLTVKKKTPAEFYTSNESPRQNFSLCHQYNIMQTSDENKE